MRRSNLKELSMAIVYYVKDGEGRGRTNEGSEVDIKELASSVVGHKLLKSEGPPIFKKGAVNPVSAYRYVVIQIFESEASGVFSSAGFYHVVGLAPSKFGATT